MNLPSSKILDSALPVIGALFAFAAACEIFFLWDHAFGFVARVTPIVAFLLMVLVPVITPTIALRRLTLALYTPYASFLVIVMLSASPITGMSGDSDLGMLWLLALSVVFFIVLGVWMYALAFLLHKKSWVLFLCNLVCPVVVFFLFFHNFFI